MTQAKDARDIIDIQAIRQVRRDIYRGISANDLPQFHRQIFQQNSEDLVRRKEDLDKIEQEFQEDAKFDQIMIPLLSALMAFVILSSPLFLP